VTDATGASRARIGRECDVGALFVHHGSMATHKKITNMKVFVHFQRFYSFDSLENLRCEPVPFLQMPFLFDTGLVMISSIIDEQNADEIYHFSVDACGLSHFSI
jgi:hypothetical protein